MFNRTLRRPMFRRGGKAEGGITSGLKRQGYVHGGDIDDHTNASGSYFKPDNTMSDMAKVTSQTVGQKLKQFNTSFPKYNNSGADFFMNLGSNILAQPGGNPILQTLGTAAREPLLQMQKTNMANTQGDRELALKFWNNLDDDEKILLQKQMDFYMSEEGGGMTQQEARDLIMYRKGPNPKEVERLKILSDQDAIVESIGDIEKTYSLGKPDAVKLQRFQKDVINDIDLSLEDRKYKLPYDTDQYFIEPEDIGERSSKDSRLVVSDIKVMDDYSDGYIYLDLESNKAYVKQGQFFIPYDTYMAEKISTD